MAVIKKYFRLFVHHLLIHCLLIYRFLVQLFYLQSMKKLNDITSKHQHGTRSNIPNNSHSFLRSIDALGLRWNRVAIAFNVLINAARDGDINLSARVLRSGMIYRGFNSSECHISPLQSTTEYGR